MAEKIINTRVQLKYDTLTNWLASSVILKAGEVAIATIANTNNNSGLTPPAIGIKVGDGNHTFADLNWIQAVAGDVPTWAKEAAGTTVQNWIDKAIGTVASGEGTTTFTSAKLIKSVTQDKGGKITNVTYEDITIDAVSGLTTRLEGIDTAIGTKLNANLASAAASTTNKLIDDNAAKTYADTAQAAAEKTASDALSAAKTEILGEAGYGGTVKGAYAEAKKANDAIAALDVTDSGTGVVTAISQTDGKIAYTKSAIDTVVAFDGDYNASSNKAATVQTVTNAVDAAKTELNQNLSQMTGAMRFRGTVAAAPTADTAAPSVDGLGAWRAGDVVLFGTAEYVVSSMSSDKKPVWQLLGDEGAYQTKLSFTEAPSSENKVVTNNTLETAKTNLTTEIDKAKTAASSAQNAADAAQATADSAASEAQKANSAIAALDVADDTSKKGFVSAVTQTDGKIAVTKKEIGFADISDVAFEGTPSKTNKIITGSHLNDVKKDITDGISGSATATAVANNQVSVLTGVTLTAGKLTRSSEYKLAAVAATGKVADIDFSDTVLVLNCGSSTVNV